MSEEESFQPENLASELLTSLTRLTNEAKAFSPIECLGQARAHAKQAEALSANNPLINMKLVQALMDSFEQVVRDFENLPNHSKAWLKGAILYFTRTEDGEHDFESVLGFEDDCEVVNACLELAGRDDLKVDPEDYD